MESADIFGSDEDSRSCESGWTMYLASQSHDHNYHCYDDDDDENEEEEEDSDGGESMESDASSGPMEATTSLKVPHDEIDEKNSTKKKKKTNEDMVIVETTTRIHDDDDGGDNHDYDDGNDSYSVVNSYVGLVREEGSV